MKIKLSVLTMILGLFVVGACSPEVGSKEWCADLEKKPKGEWSANEAAEFAKSCILK